MAEKTDRALLVALLDARHLLSDKEGQAFADMLDKMEESTRSLTKAQREWAQQKYRELDLEKKQAEEKPKPGEKFGFELMPRPLKPPTRKSSV